MKHTLFIERDVYQYSEIEVETANGQLHELMDALADYDPNLIDWEPSESAAGNPYIVDSVQIIEPDDEDSP